MRSGPGCKGLAAWVTKNDLPAASPIFAYITAGVLLLVRVRGVKPGRCRLT
ncbi:MAG: hypothetical protein AVDCRST_MAG56-7623 [uncultured Cytophagales bacterium]|uniref:Uncharacterized protein n=1 Tax=uncultured Cytophagales bacterium TaxID=158755 RepID=A0A6J4LJI0_9SPHI|nr:MAG: hypothetical protein AVDCRST_MAG56-7623 [uncultured Cytophagales bacterium]